MKIAVIFGTTEGQTHKLADYIAEMLRQRGAEVEVLDGEVMPRETPFSDYDGVIIGTAVHAGRHQRFIEELADLHHRELNQLPSALFSVSLNPARQIDEQAAVDYNNYFADKTHWAPLLEATFRGALPQNHYGFMKCLRADAMERRRHESIDMEHDYEYIDHITADGFVDEFLDLIEVHNSDHGHHTRPAP